MAAIGLLLALMLAQRTARICGIPSAHVWNLCVIALFAALIGSRLLLIVMNWHDVVRHPMWLFVLATVHHPLLIAAASCIGLLAAYSYARAQHMPVRSTADALAAPAMVGAAFEQFGALLAGSGFGTAAHVPWAIIYTHPLAARWSGAPIGIPVHPVQAYAAIAFLTLAILILVILPVRRQRGDAAGVALMGAGVVVFVTEFWRDWEGRGAVLRGGLDGPQIAAIVLLLCGALWMIESSAASVGSAERVEASHG